MKSMEQFLIIVLVAGGIHAHFPVDQTTCDLRTSTCPCSPLLNGTVYIQVMTDASGHELRFLKVLPKVNISVFNIKKVKITTDKEFNNRLTFIMKNGTLKISNLRRDDSGQYSVEVFNSNGVQEKNILFTLDVKDNGKIKAPVSSVLLVSECLSQGEMRVSCSSEGGDSPQYSWTLDGRRLTDAELLSGNNESNTITLKQHVSGHLVCSVRNNVSNVSKEERISTCEAGILPLTGGVLSVLIIVLVVGVAVIFAWRKKQNNKPTKHEEEDDQAIIYADVRFTQQQRKQVAQRGEIEVEAEYAQVNSLK